MLVKHVLNPREHTKRYLVDQFKPVTVVSYLSGYDNHGINVERDLLCEVIENADLIQMPKKNEDAFLLVRVSPLLLAALEEFGQKDADREPDVDVEPTADDELSMRGLESI